MSQKKQIQYGRQQISEDDINAVVEVLRSDFLTQGPKTVLFENAMSKYCGANHAISVNSATSGLHLALKALEIGSGDLVWTSAITFVATSNAALYCGAEIDFVDINPETINISIDALELKLKEAKTKKKLPDVVIAVHMGGLPADLTKIHKLSLEYGFHVIEDASHAVGASYDNSKIGACKYSKMCVFSLHPVKIITSGEGGVVTTNDAELARRLSMHRTHGIVRSDNKSDREKIELWNYFQQDLGYNYRMSEIHAALGLSQSKKIDTFVASRNEIVSKYKLSLKDLPVNIQSFNYNALSSCHLFIIRLIIDEISCSKIDVYNFFIKNNIQVNFHYIPVYRHPYYEKLGFKKGYFPEAEKYFMDGLSLPLHPGLKKEDIEQTLLILREALLA